MPPAKLPRAVSAVLRAAKDLERAVGALTQAVATTDPAFDEQLAATLGRAHGTALNATEWIERSLDVRAAAVKRQDNAASEAAMRERAMTATPQS